MALSSAASISKKFHYRHDRTRLEKNLLVLKLFHCQIFRSRFRKQINPTVVEISWCLHDISTCSLLTGDSALTPNGFDDKKRNLTFVKTDF